MFMAWESSHLVDKWWTVSAHLLNRNLTFEVSSGYKLRTEIINIYAICAMIVNVRVLHHAVELFCRQCIWTWMQSCWRAVTCRLHLFAVFHSADENLLWNINIVDSYFAFQSVLANTNSLSTPYIILWLSLCFSVQSQCYASTSASPCHAHGIVVVFSFAQSPVASSTGDFPSKTN